MSASREPAIEVDCLTVDLGNSRLKAIAWRPEGAGGLTRPAARFALEHGGAGEPAGTGGSQAQLAELVDPKAWLERWRAQGLTPPRRMALSNVGSPELGEQVAEALRRAFSAPLAGPPDHGLELDLRHPETVGQDRLFAARGAALLKRSAIVLDAGTALTVDALEWRGSERPRFLGGAIAPGPVLLMRALASGGARLFSVDPRPGAPALGKETAEALRAGIAVGFRGAAFELARRVGLESGLAKAPRVLCGGAADFLLEPEPFWPGELIHRPDLVHEGLRVALETQA